MKLQRFFVDTPLDVQTVSLTNSDTIHQIRKVFRMKTGDEIILLDNSGSAFRGSIEIISNDELRFTKIEELPEKPKPARELFVAQALIKKDKYEWVVQKGTEIGVAGFVAFAADRSEKKNLDLERLAIIAKEAAEQSERTTLPSITLKDGIEDILSTYPAGEYDRVVLNKGGKKIGEQSFSAKKVIAFVGPEGGWTDREIQLFKEKGLVFCSLGDNVLRAETAAVAVSVLVLSEK